MGSEFVVFGQSGLMKLLHGPSRVEGRLGLVIRVSGPGRADMRLIALLPTFLCTWELEAMHPFKWRTLLGNPIPTLKVEKRTLRKQRPIYP